MQLVQELLYQDRWLDALCLCRRATCVYFGAGRLWSLYIHLIHKYDLSDITISIFISCDRCKWNESCKSYFPCDHLKYYYHYISNK